MTQHFYIHIPFCQQKCPYCKFALTPIFDEFKKRRYIEYLKKEIREYFSSMNEGSTVNTIYFGGGTPSILSHVEITEILECFEPHISDSCEISFECNPEDINPDYINGLIKLGINRISLGVQTLNNVSLKEIQRSNYTTIFQALECLSIGGDRISVNVDFILGLPFVAFGETVSGIQELHKRFPHITHTSVYMLEDGKYPKSWKKKSLSENDIQKEFLNIMEYFESIGWNHYELSNFSRPGYESMHNQGYWNHSHFRGFGLAASSFEHKKRWANASSFALYYQGRKEDEEQITEEEKKVEELMFGLRTSGYSNDSPILNKISIKKLTEEGFIYEENKKIHLTKTGIFLTDYIMAELII